MHASRPAVLAVVGCLIATCGAPVEAGEAGINGRGGGTLTVRGTEMSAAVEAGVYCSSDAAIITAAAAGGALAYVPAADGGQAGEGGGNLEELSNELEKAESEKGRDSPDLVPLLLEIAGAHAEQCRYIPAAPYLVRALRIAETEHGPSHIEVARQLDAVGTIYYMQRDPARAKTYWERALGIADKTVGSDHPAYGIELHNVGRALLALGKTAEAEEALTKAIGILGQTTGTVSGPTVQASESLAELYLTTGQFSRSQRLLEVALAVRSGAVVTNSQFQAATKNLLGSLYAAAGLHDKAKPLLHDAEDAYIESGMTSHPDLEGILVNLAALYDAMKEADRAAGYRQRAREIHDENTGFAHAKGTPLRKALATASPARGGGAYANAQVGEWAIYSQGDDMPEQKKEVIAKTSTAVVVRSSAVTWQPEVETVVGLGERLLEDIYGVSGAESKPGELSLGGSTIKCRVLAIEEKEAGESHRVKIYFDPESIPLDGLIRFEIDGEVISQIIRFRIPGREEQTVP